MECHSNLPVPSPAANTTLGTVGPAIHDILFACARLKKLADEVELTPRPIVRIVK